MLAESVACVSDSAIQIGNKLVTEVNMQTNKVVINGINLFTNIHYQGIRYYKSVGKYRNFEFCECLSCYTNERFLNPPFSHFSFHCQD